MEAFVFEGHFPFPGKCATCGTSKGRGVDLGVDYPEVMFSDEARRGAVLLCEDCVASFYKKLGLLTPVEEVIKQEYTPEQVEEIKEHIGNAVDRLGSLFASVYTDMPDDTTVEKDEIGGLDSSTGQSNGTSVEQDSDGVSSDTSDELFSSLFSTAGKSSKSK